MKSLFLSVILALGVISNAHAFNGTIGRSNALDITGAAVPESLEKQFINVKNTHSGAIPAGSITTLDLTVDDGVSVILSGSAGLSPLCVMVKACAVGALCSCQTKGVFDGMLFDVAAASAVAGKRIYMSTTAVGSGSARTTEVATEVPAGIFFSAQAASAAVKVFLNM